MVSVVEPYGMVSLYGMLSVWMVSLRDAVSVTKGRYGYLCGGLYQKQGLPVFYRFPVFNTDFNYFSADI